MSRTRLDHASLLLNCGCVVQNYIKPFSFLKFWTESDDFMEVVKQSWKYDFSDDVFVQWKLRLK